MSSDFVLPPEIDGSAAPRLGRAIQLARRAGRLAREHQDNRGATDPTLELKGRRDLVTAADKRVEELIVNAVSAEFADDAVLAEEGVASPAGRASRDAEVCWAIDPIDGTTNFVHRHPNWSISMGVLREGKPWIGVVHAPVLGGDDGGTLWYGVVGSGAWCNGKPIRVSETVALRDALVVTGFAYVRNEPGVNTNLENFGRVLMEVRGIRRGGSAAIDIAQVAAGTYDAYWEMYLSPHDVAAGLALVLAAGGRIGDLGSGTDPVKGREVIASNGRVDAELLPLLRGAR